MKSPAAMRKNMRRKSAGVRTSGAAFAWGVGASRVAAAPSVELGFMIGACFRGSP
jgi:hypothetical protein